MTDKYDYLQAHYTNHPNRENSMTTQTITLKTGVWAAGSNYSWATDHKLFHTELEALRYAVGKYLHVFFIPNGESVRDVLEAREAAERAAEQAAEAQAQADAADAESTTW